MLSLAKCRYWQKEWNVILSIMNLAMVSRTIVIILAVLIIVFSAEVQAEENSSRVESTKPLWELGLAAGGFYTPDYPASEKNSLHGLVLPYVIYRGDFLRMGKDSILKGVFIDNDFVEFDIGVAASFNSNSNDNNARRGMPDLDYLFEIGPQLKLKIGEFYGGKTELILPLHAVFSTDIRRIDQRGYLLNPTISYIKHNIFNSRIDMNSSVGLSFATKKLHEYFYTVEPRYATSIRPAYEADGGYLGSRITLGLSYGITERIRASVGGGIGYFGGAANTKSPLFRQDTNASIHAVLTWSIFQSDTRVNPNR
jgi:outer membrane scaffolding protein for murein synthesis (MipA/OmpV family)